jgi:alkylation response protein AidB-like acyl-CoA dehydrogenase
LPVNLVAAALNQAGTEEQRSHVLPRLLSGEMIASWCMAEPQSSFGLSGMEMRAIPSGAGFLLHGVKSPVEAANSADAFLVTAIGDRGPIQLLVPASTPGISIRPLECLDLVRRFSEVNFDAVHLPGSAAVQHDSVIDALEQQLQIAAVLQCAEMIGAADRVFEFTLEYMSNRYSFGRSLASYQALKHRVADMKTWLEASKGTTEVAASSCERFQIDAPMLASVAKAWVGSVVPEIIQECVQLQGGIGVTWEHDLHLYLRRATLDRSLHGTPSDHRERIASFLVDRNEEWST